MDLHAGVVAVPHRGDESDHGGEKEDDGQDRDDAQEAVEQVAEGSDDRRGQRELERPRQTVAEAPVQLALLTLIAPLQTD